MKSMTKLSHVIVAIFLPLSFIAIWIIRNNQLPGNDASNYLLTAVNIYQHFADHGIWNGLTHWYGSRGWRPIFFPDLIVPFLLISRGNIYFAYSALAILSLSASVTYAYYYCRLLLDRYSAILAASLIGLLPLLQAQFVMFYAEGVVFACLLGALYHLIKSDYFRIYTHSMLFALLLALALIIRPVEAITQIILVLLVFLACGYYQRVFSVKQLMMVLMIATFALFAFFTSAILPALQVETIHYIDNGGMFDSKMTATLRAAFKGVCMLQVAMSGLMLLTYFKSARVQAHTKSYLLRVVMLTVAIVLIWFLPFAFETFQWLYRTSLGDVASSTGTLNGSQFSWHELQKYIIAEGSLAVYGVSLIGMWGVFAVSAKTRKYVIASAPFLYLLLTIPFPFWEAFYTVQVVTRKLSFAFPALLMALLLIGLQQGRGFKLRFIGVMLLIAAQFALLMILIFMPTQTAFMQYSLGYFIPQPSTIAPNPHAVMREFLDAQVAQYQFKSIGVAVDPGTPDARHPVVAEPIDPFLFITMLVAAKSPYAAGYPYISAYTDTSARRLGEKYDAIFLSDRAGDMLVSASASRAYANKLVAENSQSLKTFYDFLQHYASGNLNAIGWKLGPCIMINTQQHGEYRGCLLLRS